MSILLSAAVMLVGAPASVALALLVLFVGLGGGRIGVVPRGAPRLLDGRCAGAQRAWGAEAKRMSATGAHAPFAMGGEMPPPPQLSSVWIVRALASGRAYVRVTLPVNRATVGFLRPSRHQLQVCSSDRPPYGGMTPAALA